jgi:transposase
MILANFLDSVISGFKVSDIRLNQEDQAIQIELTKANNEVFCYRCGNDLSNAPSCGKHRLKIRTMPIFGHDTFLYLWRQKRHCDVCKKARSEHLEILSQESPHIAKDFSFWMGKLCEFSPISRLAKALGVDSVTAWRIDFQSMKNQCSRYQFPKFSRISVDEVYVRKFDLKEGDKRSDRFFTVISCLDRKKVLWVTEGRYKESLDEFFKMLTPEERRRIKVIAMDQFKGYLDSAKEYCPLATIVWDRFHLMKNFNEALNDERKALHSKLKDKDLKSKCAGKYKYLFLKRESRRTIVESKHMDYLMEKNDGFFKLEIIKEKMGLFFDAPNADDAFQELAEIRNWCHQLEFGHLLKWHRNIMEGWDIVKNYFDHKVTTSISEGMNNVVKALIRRGFGYKNMKYLKLKIMQQCGFLNSTYFNKHGDMVKL